MTTPTPLTITAVILAGGRGSRFQGNDKGLILFKQRPIIEHILEVISPQVSHLVINANRNLERYEGYGYPVINDDLDDFQGPLAGFAAAMAQATTSHILTLPCDGPFVPAKYMQRMRQALEQNQAELAVAHDGKWQQPIHALIPVSLLSSLEDFLRSGERKTQLWYTQHNATYVDFSESPDYFQNINTAEQLINLEDSHGD